MALSSKMLIIIGVVVVIAIILLFVFVKAGKSDTGAVAFGSYADLVERMSSTGVESWKPLPTIAGSMGYSSPDGKYAFTPFRAGAADAGFDDVAQIMSAAKTFYDANVPERSIAPYEFARVSADSYAIRFRVFPSEGSDFIAWNEPDTRLFVFKINAWGQPYCKSLPSYGSGSSYMTKEATHRLRMRTDLLKEYTTQ